MMFNLLIFKTENNVKIQFDLSAENIKYPLSLWIDKMPSDEEVCQEHFLL